MPPVSERHISLPDRYRVVRHIANGGMASVWAAEDEVLGRLVAVKVLGPGYSAESSARERFMREARAAARVSDHAHVVTIYDVGEHDGQAFIVMEHLAGGTLADRLRAADPVPHPVAVAWLEEAASALDHAHERGLVHRDVKPGNLLLDGNGRLAVGDFGIATLATDSSLTQTGQVLGTAAYLSPEQAQGRPATAASDRYALAVVAFELLAGRRPFEAEHAAAQARHHIETPPPPAAPGTDLPPAVDPVLARGLAKDPAGRPATACAFVDDLEAALGDAAEPTAATAATSVAATRVTPARFRRDAEGLPPAAGRSRGYPRTPTPPLADRGRRGRVPFLAALAALVFVLAAVIAAVAGGGGGDGERPPQTAAAKKKSGHAKRDRPRREATPAETQAPQTQAPSASKTALAQQGHALVAQGDYDGAIGVLRQAVEDCPVSTTDPCAYAMYDLGHALRLAGRPDEAIPVLQERLRNPDQRDTVQRELDLAQAQAGGGTAPPPGGNGKAKGHFKKG